MELCSMLYASLDGRWIWERMDTCVYIPAHLKLPHIAKSAIPQYKMLFLLKNFF